MEAHVAVPGQPTVRGTPLNDYRLKPVGWACDWKSPDGSGDVPLLLCRNVSLAVGQKPLRRDHAVSSTQPQRWYPLEADRL